MDKKIILAKAGAGKTYHICKAINPNVRNLVIAYTNQNISNIFREIKVHHNEVPSFTEVTTFHSFIYHTFIRPFELLVAAQYHCNDFRSKGVSLVSPEPQTINKIPNPKYQNSSKIAHYYTKECSHIYVSRMSELIVKNKEVFNAGIKYIKKFYDHFYIDEVQDFREHDWGLLELIIKKLDKVTLVGDYYQHSVSADNNSGKPFKKDKTILDYKNLLTKLGLTIDETSLAKSRRCTVDVCNFVNKVTKIDIEPHDDFKRSVVKVITDINELRTLVDNNAIMKLTLQNSKTYRFQAINWGLSKGDTYDSILVILPSSYHNMFDADFAFKSEIVRNKVYVAMTRTRGDLFLVKDELFRELGQA